MDELGEVKGEEHTVTTIFLTVGRVEKLEILDLGKGTILSEGLVLVQ